MPEHSHDFLTISLLLNGEVLEKVDGRSKVATGCQVSVKPAGVMHSDVFTQNSTMLSMKIYDPRWFGLEFEDWRWIFTKDALGLFSHLVSTENKKDAFKMLNRHLKNVTANGSDHVTWLDQIHDVVCANYRDNLSVGALADSVGKHPVYLARVFKERYGTDIKSYQSNLRLGYAISERINKNMSLTEIAYDAGFSDQSHFNRTFKRVFGSSPKRVLGDFEV